VLEFLYRHSPAVRWQYFVLLFPFDQDTEISFLSNWLDRWSG